MAYSLTDSLKFNRFQVVSVDTAASTLRVRGESEACTDFMCGEALVVTDEGTTRDLERLHPGFAERLHDPDGSLRRFVNVFVADEDVIGEPHDGWRAAMSTSSNERGMSLRSPARFAAAALSRSSSSDVTASPHYFDGSLRHRGDTQARA